MKADPPIPHTALFSQFARVFLSVAAIFTALMVLYFHFDRETQLQITQAREGSRVAVAGGQVSSSIADAKTDLREMAHMPQLTEFLDSGKRLYKKQVEKYLLNLSRESGRYDQIRYLDTAGREVIRINYNNGSPAVVPDGQLQQKRGRYYFEDTLKLGKGGIFVSPLDLNIEHGRLEIPYKPMIRLGMPVFDSAGHKKGIVLLNYFGALLLNNFRQAMKSSTASRGMLLNSSGYWLSAPDPADEWGFMLGHKDLTFAHAYPEAWQTISAASQGEVVTKQGLFVFSTLHPLVTGNTPAMTENGRSNPRSSDSQYYWKAVSFIPQGALYTDMAYNQPMGQAIIAGIYLLLALSSYYFVLISSGRKAAIQKTIALNAELGKRVAELAEKEENLAITLASIGDGVITTDAGGRVTRLNEVAERLTGWTLQEASGRPAEEILHTVNQDTREPASIPVRNTLEQGSSHGPTRDIVMIARDGSEYPIAENCAPIRGAGGKIRGAVLVLRDVSKEREARRALRDSATRIQTIFNSAGDGIVSVSAAGIIESMNPAAERIFGHSASAAIGKSVNLLIPASHSSQHDGYMRRYCETGEARILNREREVEGLRADGSTFPLSLLVNEMFLGDERHFTAIMRDITARKEAENQLDLFFSLSLDMLCISNADGYFKRVSPAFTTTLGWSTEEMLARPFLFFVHPDDHAATLRTVERQIAAGEIVLQFENRYLHKDGSWRVLSWKSVPHGDGFMFATARDVTRRKQMDRELLAAKEKAELANRAKDSFLATMSHEIRTPLTGMLGMLELLSLTSLDRDQRATLDAAWDSGRGLLRIVSDILDWSKIEEGKLELSLRATSIPRLLEEVINTYSRVASAKGLHLSLQCDPRISAGHIVDPLRLSQVLNNFVSNAVKFTPAQGAGAVELGAVSLGHEESGERIRFYVHDTGIGIPGAVQHSLFERYRQESADTARMYGGTGLGLSICRRLSDLMDGQIELESEPGKGTTFSITLTLPVSGAPGEAPQLQNLAVRQRPVLPLFDKGENAPLVLAVDDHPTNRDLMARQIRLLGMGAEVAENGKAALEKWRKGNYGLLITDCHMPEMDGYALARAIRADELAGGLARTPIIAWTANALADESDHCNRAGMDELLIKPANLAQLRQVIARCLAIPVEEDTPDARAPQAEAPIDFSELGKIVPVESEQAQVLQEFLAQVRQDLGKLREAQQSSDLAMLQQYAHRMKGSSRMVGALPLAQACAEVEQAARARDDGGTAAAMRNLDTSMAQLERFLSIQEVEE